MLQGVGGALLTPTSLALTQSSFVPEDRGAAVGAWSGLGGLAGAIGPLLGGWLVDGPGWRWAFLINVPMVIVAVIAVRGIPEQAPVRDPDGHFDLRGAALAVVALGSLTWSLTEGGVRGWGDPSVVVAAVFAVGASWAFVARERARARTSRVTGAVRVAHVHGAQHRDASRCTRPSACSSSCSCTNSR